MFEFLKDGQLSVIKFSLAWDTGIYIVLGVRD